MTRGYVICLHGLECCLLGLVPAPQCGQWKSMRTYLAVDRIGPSPREPVP